MMVLLLSMVMLLRKMKVICSVTSPSMVLLSQRILRQVGDIIITQGAMGKVDDKQTEYSTTLDADGYSLGAWTRFKNQSERQRHGWCLLCDIVTGGSITVGQIDKPNGNLFACKIICEQSVKAGTLGAASGSQLSIDFSGGYNQIIDFQSNIDNLFTSLGKRWQIT